MASLVLWKIYLLQIMGYNNIRIKHEIKVA